MALRHRVVVLLGAALQHALHRIYSSVWGEWGGHGVTVLEQLGVSWWVTVFRNPLF